MDEVILYSGSFNPVHTGHLALAEAALQFRPDARLWFVLSPLNPLKDQSQMISDAKRLSYLRKSIAGRERMQVSEVELHLPRPSYTIQTLEYLEQQYRNTKFTLLIGEDNLQCFHRWKSYREILDKVELLVYPRDFAGKKKGGLYEVEKEYSRKIFYLSGDLLPVSSTEIREKFRQGENVAESLPFPASDL